MAYSDIYYKYPVAISNFMNKYSVSVASFNKYKVYS